MSLKRPRKIRSAITGDGEVGKQQLRLQAASQDMMWQSRSPLRKAEPSIFSISSVVDEMAGIGGEIEDRKNGFLDKGCSYCNQSFSGGDIFMYSHSGFCTADCRQKQMELEGVDDKMQPIKRAKNPSGTRV